MASASAGAGDRWFSGLLTEEEEEDLLASGGPITLSRLLARRPVGKVPSQGAVNSDGGGSMFSNGSSPTGPRAAGVGLASSMGRLTGREWAPRLPEHQRSSPWGPAAEASSPPKQKRQKRPSIGPPSVTPVKTPIEGPTGAAASGRLANARLSRSSLAGSEVFSEAPSSVASSEGEAAAREFAVQTLLGMVKF